jgi:hypothetical protein
MSETGIFAYDLEPPTPPPPSAEYSPLRDFIRKPQPRPRWAPPPLPDGFARVELEDDYYTGPDFTDWSGEEHAYPARVFEIPAEQYARWKAARDAYDAMQEEISGLREERLRTPGWAPSGWVRKDKPYQVQP